jgi:predicted  nucleic acid-binding Zn ribbon protein
MVSYSRNDELVAQSFDLVGYDIRNVSRERKFVSWQVILTTDLETKCVLSKCIP